MQYSYLSKDGKYLLPAVYLTGNASALPQAPPQEEETPEETPEEPPEEPEEPPVFDAPDMEVPNVRFFVMSFCPFGQQAERGLRPVHDLLGDKIELEPNYVVYSGYCTSLAYNLEQSEQGFGDMTKEEWIEDCKPKYCLDGENYCSMHGIAELNEDIRQLCIYNNYDSDTFWNYLEYVWTNCQLGNIEECWKEAANSTGVDAETVETCFIEEGVDMIKAEKELGDEYAVRGSPTVFVNEGTYVGGRAPEDYKRGICSGFVEPPAECEETLTASGSTSTGSC
jgi:glutaredoxin